MIGAFLTFLTNSRLARWIGLTALAIAGAMGWRALERRDAAGDALAKRDAKDAEAERATHDRITKADTGAGLDDADRVSRLRDFAAKHGTRPPKAGGR